MELKWNSYRVTFETETTDVATTVFALHADAAEPMALDQIAQDLNIDTRILYYLTTELIDEDVL